MLLVIPSVVNGQDACDPCSGDTEYSSNLLSTVDLPENPALGSLSGTNAPCQAIKAFTDLVGASSIPCDVLKGIFDDLDDFQDSCCADPDSCSGPLSFVGICDCFSGRSTVQVKDKGMVPMDTLKIGDYVRVGNGGFSQVYSFGHYDPTAQKQYLQIQTEADAKPLEITAQHLLYIHNEMTKMTQVVPADTIKLGDLLVVPANDGVPTPVVAIGNVQRRGKYSPLTTSGDIVVNGVVASNYVSRAWINDGASGVVSSQVLHWLQHGASVPYRLYCAMTGGCQDEAYDKSTGFSPYVMFWFRIEQWQLGLKSVTLQVAFFTFMALPALLFVLLGMLLSTPPVVIAVQVLAALAGVYLLVGKQKQQQQGAEKRKLIQKTH